MMFILKVASALNKARVPYAIVGGHAVSLHGAVRGTVDVDLITRWSLENLIRIQSALMEIELSPRLPINPENLFHSRDEYVKNKNLVAWNFINSDNPTEQVDVVITYDLTGVTIREFKIQGETLPVISKKDLIAMKKASGREQDLLDVSALERLDDEKD